MSTGMELGLTGKKKEVLERQACSVKGTVPSWLSANLLRNGPGIFDVELEGGRGTFTVPHWFDGLAQASAGWMPTNDVALI